MGEKPFSESSVPSSDREDSVHFTRHSKADYWTSRQIRSSENPARGIDPENQIQPDLSPEGFELAEKKARELMATIDPEHDALFFVSSNEVRALETANTYRIAAHELGFEVVTPEKTGTKLAGKIGEGEIRTVHNLSLNNDNLLLISLFNPDALNVSVNWDVVDPETLAKYEQVRALVRTKDYGSFGPNFFHYSEEAAKIVPEIETARDLYERQFKNLVRLAEFAIKKSSESGMQKNIKVLAFGHENYMSYALDKYFADHNIKNCETVDVTVDDEGVNMTRNGETNQIKSNEEAS